MIFHHFQRHFLPLQLTQQDLRLGDSADAHALDTLDASGAATPASLRSGAPSPRLPGHLARTAALRLDHRSPISPPLAAKMAAECAGKIMQRWKQPEYQMCILHM